MIDLAQTKTELEVVAQAKARYSATDSKQSALQGLYDRYMDYYDPRDGDQWPLDAEDRPNMLHITVNIVKPAVDVEARLQSVLPRLSLKPNNPADPNERTLAEAVEKAHYRWLTATNWEIWLFDLAKSRSLLGKGVLKPVWNEDDGRPDVIHLEQPGRLRIGWNGSDFHKKDWALFEYKLSPLEAMIRWPELMIRPTRGETPLEVAKFTDHTDPLDTIPNRGFSGLTPGGGLLPREHYTAEDYEGKQVSVWDYWYKKVEKTDSGRSVHICNAVLVEGQLVDGPDAHDEYKEIPYVVIENDHRPGSPEGISTVKAILDLQDEFNRALSHWAQLVADYIEPAYQLTGENADDIPAGMIPKAGQVVPTGTNNRIEPLQTGLNQFPITELIGEFWNAFHRVTGLSEVLFGGMPGSQTSGRALATQIEAAQNRLSPKRARLYASIKELFDFWKYMIKAKNGTVDVMMEGEEGAEPTPQSVPLFPLLEKAGAWEIIPPELTPRDVVEHTMNVINKINAKLVSLKQGMDELGSDSPEDMIREIISERNNVDLFPGDVQIKAAVMNLLMQGQMQQQQMQQAAGMAGGESATATAQAAAGQNQALQMGANPSMGPEEGGEMAPGGPMSQPGEAGGVTGSQQTLIRADLETGQAQGLQQISTKRAF